MRDPLFLISLGDNGEKPFYLPGYPKAARVFLDGLEYHRLTVGCFDCFAIFEDSQFRESAERADFSANVLTGFECRCVFTHTFLVFGFRFSVFGFRFSVLGFGLDHLQRQQPRRRAVAAVSIRLCFGTVDCLAIAFIVPAF
jgi:hypothetical protein